MRIGEEKKEGVLCRAASFDAVLGEKALIRRRQPCGNSPRRR